MQTSSHHLLSCYFPLISSLPPSPPPFFILDRTFVSFLISLFSDYYPESLGNMYIFDAPWVFQGAWAILKGLIDAGTLLSPGRGEGSTFPVLSCHLLDGRVAAVIPSPSFPPPKKNETKRNHLPSSSKRRVACQDQVCQPGRAD